MGESLNVSWLFNRFECNLTFGFGRFIIRLTDKLSIFHQIKLVAGVELSRAEGARKALQMINMLLRPPYNLRGWNSQIT